MEYVIQNPNGKVFICLDEKGTPKTCCKSMKQTFTETKAKNILKSLPRTMRKFHFVIRPWTQNDTDEEENANEEVIVEEETTTINNGKSGENILDSGRVILESSMRWIERSRSCNSLLKDAVIRRDELLKELENVEKEKCDILHIVELTAWKNVCGAYTYYKRLKNNLEKRREIKDELLIVSSIISARDIEEVVKKMNSRVYEFRCVEDMY